MGFVFETGAAARRPPATGGADHSRPSQVSSSAAASWVSCADGDPCDPTAADQRPRELVTVALVDALPDPVREVSRRPVLPRVPRRCDRDRNGLSVSR